MLTNQHVFTIISADLPYLGNWQHSSYHSAIKDNSLIRGTNIHLFNKDIESVNVDLSFAA
ncbi:MAG: hypothetical protein MJK10_03690 [Pseudomonadales bacterium]|nr:hypothetical protein [Pseudomonadales bacterium]NRA15173.1 hypothetical protein [Oceanospirillaceae bacterium]